MQAQHTPGPWIHNGRDGRLQQSPWNGWSIIGRDGKSVAACASSVDRPDAEKFANGRLIAAAPEMLRVLMLVANNEHLTEEQFSAIHSVIGRAA